MARQKQKVQEQEATRTARIVELESDLAAAKLEIENLQFAVAEREEAITHQQEALRAAREQLESKREELNDIHARLSQQQDALAESQMLLDEQLAELQRQRAQLQREQAEFYRQKSELPSAPGFTQQVGADATTNRPSQTPASPLDEGSHAQHDRQAAIASVGLDSSPDDDESVEDYVTRMMARMGVQHAASPMPQQQAAPLAPSQAPTAGPPSDCDPAPLVVDVSTPEEYVPRCQAPENVVDLAAMRAVANTAAAAALKSHARRRRIKLSARTGVVAVLSLLGSVAITGAWVVHRAPIAQFGATFFFVLGVGCTLKALFDRFRPW